jgi:hypothetical protein
MINQSTLESCIVSEMEQFNNETHINFMIEFPKKFRIIMIEISRDNIDNAEHIAEIVSNIKSEYLIRISQRKCQGCEHCGRRIDSAIKAKYPKLIKLIIYCKINNNPNTCTFK